VTRESIEDIYVAGRWIRTESGTGLGVTDAATEEIFAVVPDASGVEVDRAVQAARAAFPAWVAAGAQERSTFLRAIADELEAARAELAVTIAREVGTPVAEARTQQVDIAVRTFRVAADLAAEAEASTIIGQTRVARRPIGVVGCIVPWNYPLYLTATKVAPALAAGCTVVVKPSEVAPLSVFALARAADRVGLPPGVLNVVSGAGATVGASLASNPLLDAVSFTGSPTTGRRVAQAAGEALHRVTLELGGKSPSVVLDDADLEQAVRGTVAKGFQNAGQTCAALTRLIVPRKRLRDAEMIAAEAVGSLKPGNPLDSATTLGPVASAAQQARIQRIIRRGVASGARLVVGGPDRPAGLDRGYYVEPTVFSDVSSAAELAREEIFGPVLAIQSYRDEDEALTLANDSDYGLSGAVWSADLDRARRVAEALEAGSVSINGAPTHPDAPFGGFKQSGFGRERGAAGLHEFLTTQALHGAMAERVAA
jgi:acyl-CoA reductase-like NAD-dependent aldehyde dehydrogenase